MPRRSVNIDMDGEIIEMPWDRPDPPTKKDFTDWIQQRRNGPPTSHYPKTPDPGIAELPADIPKSLQLPVQAPTPAPQKDTGFLGAIGEGISGLGHFGSTVLKSSYFNPDRASQQKAAKELIGGVTEPFMQAGREAYEYEKKGEYGKALARTAAVIPEAGLGIPATQITRDVGEGRYGHAAGSALFGGALAYLGAKGGKKTLGAQAGEAAIPNVPSPAVKPPAVTPRPEQMPLGFDTPPVVPEQMPLGFETPKPISKVMPEVAEGPVGKAAASGIPELQDAAKKTTMYQRVRERAWNLPGASVAADIGKSSMSVIRDSGPVGKELVQKLSRTRLLGEYIGQTWKGLAKQATEGLTPEQIKVYIESREKGVVPNDPAVQVALEKRAALDAEVVKTTKESGAGLRTAEGEIIPFRERTNYWPHIYDKKSLRKNKQSYIDSLVKEGWSADDAQRAVERSSQYGERLISAQHERQGNAPGFRTDLDADYLHLDDMAKRVAEAREYGPRDLADTNSPLSKLVDQTAEPQRVREALNKWLGREVPKAGHAQWGEVTQRVKQVMSAAHLSHFGIGNMSQLATVPLRANLDNYAGALGQVLTKKGRAKARSTGALQNVEGEALREVGGESFISKLYGMKKSETLNRSVAAASGSSTAESLFAQLKKNPNDKLARQRLENLVLEPVDKVLKQDSLSPEQTGIAGGRMAEITQGRAESIDLPKLWSVHPAAEIPIIFKKYAFQQTRIIKDAIMENPKRNIPLALALYTAVGEGIGDVKAGIKGTVSGQGGWEAIAARGEGGITGQQEIDRIASNLAQAWALGILTDLVASGGKPSGLAEFVGGVALSDAGKIAANTEQLMFPGPEQTRLGGFQRQGARAIPFVGSGIAERIGGGGSKSSLPRPPRIGSSLPRVPRP